MTHDESRIPEADQTQVLSNSTSVLSHSIIRVGQPVIWNQTISLNDTSLENILIEIPSDAKLIKLEQRNQNGTLDEIPMDSLETIDLDANSTQSNVTVSTQNLLQPESLDEKSDDSPKDKKVKEGSEQKVKEDKDKKVKEDVEEKIKALKDVLKSDEPDKDELDKKSEELSQAIQKIGEEMGNVQPEGEKQPTKRRKGWTSAWKK